MMGDEMPLLNAPAHAGDRDRIANNKSSEIVEDEATTNNDGDFVIVDEKRGSWQWDWLLVWVWRISPFWEEGK